MKMENLPVEILSEILSYLPLQERKDKRLVNQLWNQIMPSLDLNIEAVQEVQDNLRKIGILVVFVDELLDFAYEEKNIKFKWTDEKGEKIASLDVDYEGDYTWTTSSDFGMKESDQIYDRLLGPEESEEWVLQTLMYDLNLITTSLPRARWLSVENNKIDLKQLMKKAIPFVVKGDKDPKLDSIMLIHYKILMNQYKEKIESEFPAFIRKDVELYEKYLNQIT